MIPNKSDVHSERIQYRIEENIIINQQRLREWEREKERIENHNTQILEEANKEIDTLNLNRNKIEITDINTGITDVILFF